MAHWSTTPRCARLERKRLVIVAVHDCGAAAPQQSAGRARLAAPRRGETRFTCGTRLRRCRAAAACWTGAACRTPTRRDPLHLRYTIAALPRRNRALDGRGLPRPDAGRPASPAVHDCGAAAPQQSAGRARLAAPRRGETRFTCGTRLRRCRAATERWTGAACRAPTRRDPLRLRYTIAALPRRNRALDGRGLPRPNTIPRCAQLGREHPP